MANSTSFSRTILHCITVLIFSLCIHSSLHAQQTFEGDGIPPKLTSIQDPQSATKLESTMSAHTAEDIAANNSPEQRLRLQQELRTLLAENSRINQEKIQYLETQSRRVFWTQCLIGFLILMMLVSLISFWRLHVQHQFQHGIDALSSSLKHFQDSLFSLSFIDTSQLSTASNVSSFQITGTDAETTFIPANSVFRKTLNPNTGTQGDEFSDIRGFFDAWLNVYKPGDPRYEEAMAAANKPTSPRPWLEMLDAFLHNKDQHGFESISKEIKKFFNVKIHGWQTASVAAVVEVAGMAEKKQLSDYPHVIQKIMELWSSDEIVIYLERLLNNSRMSPREGFDLAIFEQLESLLALAQTPDRPRQLNQLRDLGLASFLFQPLKVAKAKEETETDMIDLRMAENSSGIQVSNAIATRDNIITKKELSPPSSVQAARLVNQVNKPLVTEDIVVNTVVESHAESPHQNISEATIKITPEIRNTSTANVNTVTEVMDEETLFAAHEVRLQLALAYREIADTEGACLLLEDVIRAATPAQQAQARQLLIEIENTQARICGDNEEIYFAASSALTAAKNA